MRLVLALLCASLLSPRVLGDEEVSRDCLAVPEPDKTLKTVFYERDEACLKQFLPDLKAALNTLNATGGVEDHAQLRSAFKVKCNEVVSRCGECQARVQADAATCLVQSEKITFRLFTTFLLQEVAVFCANDAEYFFANAEADRSEQEGGKKNVIQLCRSRSYSENRTDDQEPETVNTSLQGEFHLLQRIILCLEQSRGDYDDAVISAGINAFTILRDTMMCVDVQNDEEILCKTIFIN